MLDMPESYNLRSLQRKRDISTARCYLHDFSASTSHESFNPKVCLERLKFLESPDNKNNRFILENGRIVIKPKHSFVPNKKFIFQILCTIILLIVTSFYLKDYFQRYSVTFIKNYSKILPIVQSYYFELVYTQKRSVSEYKYKVNCTNKKLVSNTSGKEFTSLNDNCDIKQLVKDYFVELEKHKIENISKESKLFIEEQCRQSLKDNSDFVMDDFYNSTFLDQDSLIDYALESQGARIVTVFNTEPYEPFAVNFLKFDLGPGLSSFLIKHLKFFNLNGPNSVLIPWRKPGDCWAFKGSQGRILIELSDSIVVTGVTIDHLPREAAPEGSFHSAPKKFFIYGVLRRKNEDERINLGSFEYKSLGPASQTFFIQPVVEAAFKRVAVIFKSNHGNQIYTCVYKIRIHGHK